LFLSGSEQNNSIGEINDFEKSVETGKRSEARNFLFILSVSLQTEDRFSNCYCLLEKEL